MPELHHLSYSSIALYLECPRKWFFRYVRGLKAPATPSLILGTVFHATIARMLRERFSGNDPDPSAIWLEEWGRAVQGTDIDWGVEIPDAIANDGLRLIAHGSSQDAIAQLAPFLDEAGFFIERRIELRVPGVPVPVIGYIDLLSADGIVHDFKTAARAWTSDQAQQEAQPIYYLAALNQMGVRHQPGRARHMVFVKTKTPQVLTLDSTHTVAEMFWLFDVIGSVWRAIQAGHFPPNPKSCFAWGRRCEFFEQCRGKR